MLYLKLYEAFNREDFYQEIDSDEYYSEVDEDEFRLRITTSEISLLRDKIVPEYFSMSKIVYSDTCLEIPVFGTGVDSESYYIFKCRDEWWYILERLHHEDDHASGNYYYKCDQWEGLMRFLTDKNFIKN
jgi:hypothetical protein